MQCNEDGTDGTGGELAGLVGRVQLTSKRAWCRRSMFRKAFNKSLY